MIEIFGKNENILLNINKFSSGNELLKCINCKNTKFDIIFMDIKMQNLDGIETSKRIRELNEYVFLVFISSFSDYVFDVFDVNARGFLVKPVDKDKLFTLMLKIIEKLNVDKNQTLSLSYNGIITKILLIDIYYCEVRDHSLYIYKKDEINQYQGKIDTLEKELNDNFFRCHRSFIVNFSYVEKYQNGFVYLPNGEKIPVANRRQKEFTQKLLLFNRKEVR